MDNSSDRKSIRAKEKQALVDAASRASVVRSIMSTAEGRAWIWNLLIEAHMQEINAISDPRLSGIFDGERNFGIRLMTTVMSTCPDQFIQAMRESYERSSLDERRSGSVLNGRDSGSSDGPTDEAGDLNTEWAREVRDDARASPDPDGIDEAIRRLEANRQAPRQAH